MKKVLCFSGILTVLLLILFLTGWAPVDDTVKKAINNGNKQFRLAYYEKALMGYKTGLSVNAYNKPLNFNAAQAAYLLSEYEKAIEYFNNSGEEIEKFLTSGNICYKSGEAVEDINQKTQLFSQALQFYKEGIIKYPQDVSLKYNYEFVKDKLDELLENMEQENNEQGEEGEESENQDNQEQESGNSENSQEEQDKQNSENSENSQDEQNSENSQSSQDEQEQDSENSQSSQDEQEQDSENSKSSQEEQNQESDQNKETGDNQSQLQDNNKEQEEDSSQNDESNTADQEAVARILQMLENQEEQSLKNNQEVVGGNEGKHGW